MLPDCTRDILGIWIENTEGAKFWMKVFNDLKTRGVNDILIAVTDGLKGMPEALVSTANDWVINCAMNDVRCSAVKSSLISAQFDPLDLKRSSNSTTFRSLSSMGCLPRNSSSFPPSIHHFLYAIAYPCLHFLPAFVRPELVQFSGNGFELPGGFADQGFHVQKSFSIIFYP